MCPSFWGVIRKESKVRDFNDENLLFVFRQINSQDDSGVLMGRWDGSYDFGFQPSHWSGSHAILKHWLNNFCRRVKYGQCWVFAGVMCSGNCQ